MKIPELRKLLLQFPLDSRVEYIGADRQEFSDEPLYGTVDWINQNGMLSVTWDRLTGNQLRWVWSEDLARVEK